MEKFIFEQNRTNTKKVETREEFFTVLGNEDFLDDNSNPRITEENNNKVYAKRILRDDGSYRYSIRLATSGKLYNPLSIYDNKENKKFLETISRNQNAFREVNYTSFHLYLRFLKTKNVAYLNNAERERE
jgi:hypothetical protein